MLYCLLRQQLALFSILNLLTNYSCNSTSFFTIMILYYNISNEIESLNEYHVSQINEILLSLSI